MTPKDLFGTWSAPVDSGQRGDTVYAPTLAFLPDHMYAREWRHAAGGRHGKTISRHWECGAWRLDGDTLWYLGGGVERAGLAPYKVVQAKQQFTIYDAADTGKTYPYEYWYRAGTEGLQPKGR